MEQSLLQGDNQQRRTEDRLSWLGGIIDGEGTITLMKRKKAKGKCGFIPRIGITNTNTYIMKEAKLILDLIKIPYTVVITTDKKHLEWKPAVRFAINGFNACYKCLPFLLPYLIAKKEKAELLFKWIAYRFQCKSMHSYTKEDSYYIEKIRDSYVSPNDYTQNTFKSEDIV